MSKSIDTLSQQDQCLQTSTTLDPKRLEHLAHALFAEEKSRTRLDGWFLAKEIQLECEQRFSDHPASVRAALALQEIASRLPLELSDHAVFAGTQRDAFARSYALINPSFEVETFSGYCDPTAVYNDIEPSPSIPRDRIEALRERQKRHPFVRALSDAYRLIQDDTAEVSFFIEQVTGHVIPDMRPLLADGIDATIERLDKQIADEADDLRRHNFNAMRRSLQAVLTLAVRYRQLALDKLEVGSSTPQRQAELQLLADTLAVVPAQGARTLYQAIQSFLLLWQVMCLEQAPNPFAFSVGNADRIFEPYRRMDTLDRDQAAGLFKHFLVFFNVGDRSWAISQNIMVGGRDTDGNDLTSPTSYALLDAYFAMNLPQPILSVKLHRSTPTTLYRELGRFFFTPGTLTPSLFNDDSLFAILEQSGIARSDLPDYSIAGCQEPLIMGKDNGNTTNSWLNLAKILELTLQNGRSALTGRVLGETDAVEDPLERLQHLRTLFFERLEWAVDRMVHSANEATAALELLPVPFLSTLMGGIESGYDMRDVEHQGTIYNGSGCLIHGLAVVADSFVAIDYLLKERPEEAGRLLIALRNNFADDEALRQYLVTCPKFGNNHAEADREAARLVERVSDLIASRKNNLGNPFRPDYATPSTHLLYGYWVGATPDGRRAREMLSYGTDPLAGDAAGGMGFRMLSGFALPYDKMCGGYASHFGIDPKYFREDSLEDRGLAFHERVIHPLFFNKANRDKPSPFYLYVNISTAETLRKVLANPKRYAPSGVYIMRIHGTFVNFLDLSPAIQQDIIIRLDPDSSALN